MTFTDQFGTNTVRPVTTDYQAIALASIDMPIYWPLEAEAGAPMLASWLDVTPSGASLSLLFPDARSGSQGFASYVSNLGSNSFTINNNGGGSIQVVAAGEVWLIWLKDSSTSNGTWGTLKIGSTTSIASAGTLAGLGIKAIGLTLNQSHPVWDVSSDYTIVPTSDRARLLRWTGGAGTISFPSASSLGDDFFALIANSGSGSVVIDPFGGETIDGAATKTLAQGESCFVICSGTALITVGYGRSVDFTETYLNKNVAGSSNVVLTSTEFSSSIMRFFGALTGSIDVEVPATPHSFVVVNDSTGAFTITVKVAGMTGVVAQQGQSMLLYCNGTDVFAGNTVNTISTGFFNDGSAAAPSISFTSDTDTGFYRPGSNQLAVAAGGITAAIFNTVASGVNALTVTPSATGIKAVLGAYSSIDADVGIAVTPQGAGEIDLNAPTNISGNLKIATNKLTIDALTGNTYIAGREDIGTLAAIAPASTTGAGSSIYASGVTAHSAAGTAPLLLQRTADDGDLIVFYRDTAAVGSIYVNGAGALFTGNVSGNLTGNVTGNVTGTVTGNASTATALQTSRDFSIAGSTGLTAVAVGFTGAANVALTLTGTLVVANGGTGVATLAAHGVLIGNGTSPVAVTGAGTAGQVLTSNGAAADPTFQALPPSTGRLLATQYFTTGGTYTPTAGMGFCVVRATGGGGGGGGGKTGGSGTGGGGGGAAATGFAKILAAAIGASQAVTIGAGGAGGGSGAGGSNGAQTTLGAILSINGGGGGGSSINISASGIGSSTTSGADTTINGGDGCTGIAANANAIFGGNGGSSYFGGGGMGGYSSGGGITSALGGKSYGSGGGGGGANGASGGTGGTGADGYMLIEEYS